MLTDADVEDLEDPVVVRDIADAELVAIDGDRMADLPLDQLLDVDDEVTVALLGNGAIAGAVQVVDVGDLERDDQEVDDADD